MHGDLDGPLGHAEVGRSFAVRVVRTRRRHQAHQPLEECRLPGTFVFQLRLVQATVEQQECPPAMEVIVGRVRSGGFGHETLLSVTHIDRRDAYRAAALERPHPVEFVEQKVLQRCEEERPEATPCGSRP